MTMTIDDELNQTLLQSRHCAICQFPAIGINFGALTCAPCKAFFRRNARRKEILLSSCSHHKVNSSEETNHEIIRRCTVCRLRRCFQMGMKESLVRTDEENRHHKQLVDMNRQRKQLLRQKQAIISQCPLIQEQFLKESDWRHLSNIVAAYDTHCLTTYTQQRSIIFINETDESSHPNSTIRHHITIPMSLTGSLFSFLRALPAFHSLSYISRKHLCKHNLRPLLFLSMMELKQSCFSESWQTALEKHTWLYICGLELYHRFVQTEQLAERSLIADPTITRLWLIVLFFSSSLSFVYTDALFIKSPKKRTAIIEIQNSYVTLLWNYLLHRYGELLAIQIYSNLVYVFLKMQDVGVQIDYQMRTRNDLAITNQAIDQILSCETRVD